MITVITHDQAWELAQLGVPLFARREDGSSWRLESLHTGRFGVTYG